MRGGGYITVHFTVQVEPQISYIAAVGRQLNQVRLTEIIEELEKTKTKAINTYSAGKYVHIFVPNIRDSFYDFLGFKLVMLKTEKHTGEALKEIHYF